MQRVFSYLLSAAAMMALTVLAYSPETVQARSFSEGLHYGIISPAVPTQAEEGKIEVAEVFWYGCPHCYNLEPTMKAYLAQKPDNISFNLVPAMLSPKWSFHGKLHHVGRILDADGSKKVHEKMFAAMHKQRRRIDNDDQMRRFFKGLGFKKKDINDAMKSEELKENLKHADEISNKSGLDSVPTIIVNGKYLTSPTMLNGANLVEVINFLVKMAAADK